MEPNSSAPSESSRGSTLRKWYFSGFVLFITAFTYLGTLRFDFVSDDDPLIRNNPLVQSWQYISQYFSGSAGNLIHSSASANYYRPLFLLWIRVNNAFFGLRPIGWHLAAVLLHALVTWLVYFLVQRLTGRFTVAWLTALIFGVHPIHHEVVSWISGTAESLFAALFLAAFLAYLKSSESSKTIWMSVSALGYGLALLCKETAIVLPALVFVAEWISWRSPDAPSRPGFARRFGQALKPIVYYVPIAAIYLAVRSRILPGFGHAASNGSVLSWLLTLPSILFFYVRHWFYPVGLSEFYDLSYQSGLNLMGVILPAIGVIVMAIAVWMLRKPLGDRDTDNAVAWLVVPLIPALDTFVFSNGGLVHDRYFYLSSIGASLLVALIVERALAGEPSVFGQPVRIIGTAIALAAILGFLANWQTSFWQNNYTLYLRGHQIAPRNATAMNNLAGELIAQNEIDVAQPFLETGYREFPGDGRIAYNLGRLNYIKKQYAKSEEYAREAIRLDPTRADSYVLLGQILMRQDKPQEATQNLQRAVELNPYDSTYHTSYGILLKMAGDCTGANSQFDQALALSPTDAITHLQMLGCQASLTPANDSTPKTSQP